MARLSDITGSTQLSLDDVLVEFRADPPPEAAREGRKEPSVATAGADPDVIMADLETVGNVSQVKKGTESHNGICPYTQQCETRRRRLPTYRQHQLCHWLAWGDWWRCPIYRSGGVP
jgi:hypothetical protein